MTEARDALIETLEGELGYKLEYRSMGPSVFGYFDVRGLRIFGGAAGLYTREYPLLAVDRIRVSYSFFALLEGDSLRAVRSIRLDGPVFSLQPGENPELSALARRLGGGPASPASGEIPLEGGLRISVRRGACFVRSGGSSAGFRGLAFDARLGQERLTLRGKWSTTLSIAYLPERIFTVGMAGRLQGEYDTRKKQGAVTLNIPAAQGEGFTVSAMNFHIALTEEGFTVSKIADRVPYTLTVAYEFDSRRVSGEFRADDFSPRELLILSGARRQYNSYLTMSITGSASFDSKPGGVLSYGADLEGFLGAHALLGRVRYRVHGEGDQRGASFRDLGLRFNRGEIAYRGDLGYGPLAPNGVLSVRDFSLTGDGDFNGEFSLSGDRESINVYSEGFSLGKVSFAFLDGEFSRPVPESAAGSGDAFLSLTAFRFRNLESWENVETGELNLRGGYSPNPREIQASLAFDSFSAGDLLEMVRPFKAMPRFSAGMAPELDRVLVTTEVFFSTDFRHVTYNAPQVVAAYGGFREILVLSSVSGTDRRFELGRSNVAWGDGGMEFSGMVDISTSGDTFFSFQTMYRDLVYFFQGTIMDRGVLSFAGSYGLQGGLARGPRGELRGSIEAGPVPIPAGEGFAQLFLSASLNYEGEGSWTALLDNLEISGLPTPASANTLIRLSGQANQDGGDTEFILDDGRSPLSGRVSFLWEDGVYSASARLESRGGAEYYALGGLYREGVLELSLEGERMQLHRFFGGGLNPVAAGSARFRWENRDYWTLDLALDSLSARQGGNSLELKGRGFLDRDTLALEDLFLNYGGLVAELDRLSLNRAEGLLGTAGVVRGSALGEELNMAFMARLNLAPMDSWLDLGAASESLSLRLDVASLSFGDQAAQPFSVNLLRSAGSLSLSGGPGNMLRLSLDDEGNFHTSLSYPSPLRGSFTGLISTGTIDIASSSLYLDLGSLFRLIPENNAVNCGGGIATGRLRIQGPLGDPEFYGALYATGVRLTVPAFLGAEIGPTPITVILDGNEMSFGPQYATVGAGAAVVNAWFRFERWIPNTFKIDIRAEPETPVPFAFDLGGVMAQGGASGVLTVAMENRELRVLGNLTGDDAEIILALNELVSGDSPPPERDYETPVSVEITLKSGRKVDLYWPNSNMPILRASIAAGTGMYIKSDSLAGSLSLDGDVTLKSGEIYYVQRSFYIRNGILEFSKDEAAIDPRITARAEVRERSEDGPVTISMIVENEPLSSFTARFESSPPLSQAEIFSLLGQSFINPSGEADPSTTQNALLASMDILTQLMLSRRVERTLRNFLGLDMFSFRTSLIRNVVSQVWNPVDRGGVVGNYFDNTTVYVGKYVGTNMFVQGMVSLRYDELLNNRMGVFGQDKGLSIGPYTLEPEIGIELSSPLVDIRWNIAPLHSENLFVNDMSFSLTWRWTLR
ncbi:MAG: translocation/assembly module TamB [Spirochaetaceae bacterium]|jgi:hypothetical protein|nr:translocation/assembly module TamB [Spirochaetaceae bacterium]